MRTPSCSTPACPECVARLGENFRRAFGSRPDPLPPAEEVCRRYVHRARDTGLSPGLVRKSFSKMPNPAHSVRIRVISRKVRSSRVLVFRIAGCSLDFGFALILMKHFRSRLEIEGCPYDLLKQLCTDGSVTPAIPALGSSCSPALGKVLIWLALSHRKIRGVSRQRSLCLPPRNWLQSVSCSLNVYK